MAFEKYIEKGGRKLRCGYTTGSCAALAAAAAARMLLGGGPVDEVAVDTPNGVTLSVPVLEAEIMNGAVRCAVRKDAGDDPDATDGALVYATVKKTDGHGVNIDGGAGIGRVTRPGLEQPVGAAAINSVPRSMIEREVRAVCDEFGYGGGLSVVVSMPDGERLAAKTFNPSLGIVGGLSILGTTGIVEPMSDRAIIDTIGVELKMRRAEGASGIILTPGNYGESFLRGHPEYALRPAVKCANFIGEALDAAAVCGFESVLLVGHLGKLVKLAGGIMDTHSRVADCRMELLALHAALCGAEAGLLRELLDAVAVDDGVDVLDAHSLRERVMRSLLERIDFYLGRRTGGAPAAGALLFSNRHGVFGVSAEGRSILNRWEKGDG